MAATPTSSSAITANNNNNNMAASSSSASSKLNSLSSSHARTTSPSATSSTTMSASSSTTSNGCTPSTNNNDGSETAVPPVRLVDPTLLTTRSSLRCGLCNYLIESPSYLPCSIMPGASPHYYCRRCLMVHVTVNGTCPMGCAPPSKSAANGGGSESKNGSKPFHVRADDVRLLCDTNKAAFCVFVDGVDVHCPFTQFDANGTAVSSSTNGCVWKGNYSDSQTHLESKCHFYKSECCMCHCLVAGAKSVHPAICAARPVACERCNQMVPLNQHTTHMDFLCPAVLVSCTIIHDDASSSPTTEIKGCGAMIKRGQLADHQRNVCPKAPIACPLAPQGCTVRVPRECMRDHEQCAAGEHVALLLTAVTTSERAVDAAKALVRQLTDISVRVKRLPDRPVALHRFGGFPHVSARLVTSSTDGGERKWSELPIMGRPAGDFGCCVLNERIYTVGGCDGPMAFKEALCYNPKVRAWLPLAPLPRPLAGTCAVACQGKVYAIGGLVANTEGKLGDGGKATAEMFAYDPLKNEWKQMKSMSNPRAHHNAVELGGKIYVFGGRLSNTMTSYLQCSAERYDPATNEWTNIAPPASPRAVAAACVIDDSIAVLGGGIPRHEIMADTITHTVEIYRPSTNTWSRPGWLLPTPRAKFSAAYHDGFLYIIGGFNNGTPLATCDQLELSTGKWSSLPPLPLGSHSGAVAMLYT